MKSFFAGNNIASCFNPVDMQTAANTGDWISMKNHGRLVFVLFKGIGTAGDDPIFKLQQGQTSAGTNAKDLLFTTIFKKVGVLTAIGQFTKVTQAAATSYVDTDSAEAATIMAVEVLAEQLDSDGGFDHVQLSVADVGGNAQLGCAFVLALDPRHAYEPSLSCID